jgi:hypothetical protein
MELRTNESGNELRRIQEAPAAVPIAAPTRMRDIPPHSTPGGGRAASPEYVSSS